MVQEWLKASVIGAILALKVWWRGRDLSMESEIDLWEELNTRKRFLS